MSFFRRLFRTNMRGGRASSAGSRFERFEFSPGRFECTLSALAHAGACEGLFLNRYSGEDIRGILRHTGLDEHLAGRGFRDLRIAIDSDDSRIHCLRVYGGREDPRRILIELRLSEVRYTPDGRLAGGILKRGPYPSLAVEWVNLQDPRRRFTADRPRLPGQVHPGLGAVGFVFRILETIAGDLGASAVLDVPERFHAAVMYSKKFSFTDPARQGMMEAALRDLAGHTLADISWGFLTGAVRDARTGGPVAYEPSEQIMPLAGPLAEYVSSRAYRTRRDAAMREMKLVLDYDEMVRRRKRHPEAE